MRSFVHVNEYSSMRGQIAFCIFKLRNNEEVQIGGMGIHIPKAIMMVEIIKERIGWLH